MTSLDASLPWWRPAPLRTQSVAAVRTGGSVAFVALVTFTAILLLSPQAWIPVLKVFRIAFLAAGLALAAHVVSRTVRREPVVTATPEILAAFLLVGWAVLTIPLSSWPGGSVRLLTDHYLKAVAFFWLLATVLTTPERVRTLVWTLVLCSIPLAGFALRNYAFSEQLLSTPVEGFYRIDGYGRDGSGLTSNPNDLALMLNLIIPLAGAMVMSERGLGRLVALAALLMSAGAVVVTFSRAGFLTLAAVFVMFLFVLARRRAVGLAGGLLLIPLLMVPFVPASYFERLSTIANIEADVTGSAQGRWADVKLAGEVIADHPVVGVGLGQDMVALNQNRGSETWRSVHNAYLQYAVDLGIPGALLFVGLHLLCFLSARAAWKCAALDPRLQQLGWIASGIQIALVAFIVAAMFHPIAYQFYFFSIGGLAVAARHACRSTTAPATSHV